MQAGKFDFKPLLDVGEGEPVILLHGLFGNLSNWSTVANEFQSTHRLIIPTLPFYSTPITKLRLDDLVDYVEQFIETLMNTTNKVTIMGNSLGGHVALLYAWRHPEKVNKLVLAGSSGLYESSFAGTFPRVKDYEYVQRKVQGTFYKPEVATKELVDEVYDTVQSRMKTLSIIGLARAAQHHNVASILDQIKTPTLLIWGLQDTITPPEVAVEFHDKLPNSTLLFLEHCGHVPMMEQPKLLMNMFENFWNTKVINYAAFAIPAFFLFIGLEYAAAKRKKKGYIFKFDSSIANISIGIGERLLNLFLTASFYGVFNYIYVHFAIWSIPNNWAIWLLLILVTDLVWYWYHRLGHEINILWAAHIVHHHSEEFNYSVAARITSLQSIVRNAFWCFLPLAGFHPDMVLTILIVHGTYSFFTHTELIHTLGWFENVLITPSHHRVHHSSNEKYLNKNYGDLFVFWDKLFGTFQREDEKPVYGLTHPLKSYSFLWQHFHYFMEIGLAVSKTTGIMNKVRIIIGKPEMLDQNLRTELERKYLPKKRRASHTRRYKVYLIIQVVVAVLFLFLLTLFYKQLNTIETAAITVFILVTLINCGALLEQHTWIYYLEYFRLLIVLNYISYRLDSPTFLAVSLIFILMMIWPMQKWYLRFVYNLP